MSHELSPWEGLLRLNILWRDDARLREHCPILTPLASVGVTEYWPRGPECGRAVCDPG